jgi:hypothetical protein
MEPWPSCRSRQMRPRYCGRMPPFPQKAEAGAGRFRGIPGPQRLSEALSTKSAHKIQLNTMNAHAIPFPTEGGRAAQRPPGQGERPGPGPTRTGTEAGFIRQPPSPTGRTARKGRKPEGPAKGPTAKRSVARRADIPPGARAFRHPGNGTRAADRAVAAARSAVFPFGGRGRDREGPGRGCGRASQGGRTSGSTPRGASRSRPSSAR